MFCPLCPGTGAQTPSQSKFGREREGAAVRGGEGGVWGDRMSVSELSHTPLSRAQRKGGTKAMRESQEQRGGERRRDTGKSGRRCLEGLDGKQTDRERGAGREQSVGTPPELVEKEWGQCADRGEGPVTHRDGTGRGSPTPETQGQDRDREGGERRGEEETKTHTERGETEGARERLREKCSCRRKERLGLAKERGREGGGVRAVPWEAQRGIHPEGGRRAQRGRDTPPDRQTRTDKG